MHNTAQGFIIRRVEPLPRLDSNQDTKIQNLVSYQLDDRANSTVATNPSIRSLTLPLSGLNSHL